MARIDRGDFVTMSEGAEVRARRERLGMSIVDLAKEAGVSRDTLSDLESGTKDFRRLTLSKVQKALDEIELEAGIDVPPAQSDDTGLVEFEVTGDFGVRVVVKGPVRDADAIERQVVRLIRDIRDSKPAGDK